jgi:hypothetical protein
MSKFVENKLSMYEGTGTLLKANAGKLAAIPALAAAAEDFADVVGRIKAKGLEVDNASAGKAQKKANAEEELLDALLPVSSALSAMAAVSKDPELKARVVVTEAQLRKMRDTDLAKKADGIYQAGVEKLAAAADFGITQEMLTELDAKSKAFSQAMGERESSVGQRIGARSAMMDLYDEADAILTGRLDNLMGLLRKKEAQFCEEYNSTRVIRDAGLRHKPVASPQEQATAQSQPAEPK